MKYSIPQKFDDGKMDKFDEWLAICPTFSLLIFEPFPLNVSPMKPTPSIHQGYHVCLICQSFSCQTFGAIRYTA